MNYKEDIYCTAEKGEPILINGDRLPTKLPYLVDDDTYKKVFSKVWKHHTSSPRQIQSDSKSTETIRPLAFKPGLRVYPR